MRSPRSSTFSMLDTITDLTSSISPFTLRTWSAEGSEEQYLQVAISTQKGQSTNTICCSKTLEKSSHKKVASEVRTEGYVDRKRVLISVDKVTRCNSLKPPTNLLRNQKLSFAKSFQQTCTDKLDPSQPVQQVSCNELRNSAANPIVKSISIVCVRHFIVCLWNLLQNTSRDVQKITYRSSE